MNTLSTIAVYAPNRLDVPTFKAGFVARQELADFLLDRLREIPTDGVADHRLIVGQRGMGKTSLLRRLAIGIAEDADLAARYIPLTFREEQYNVRSLDRFWRNCGDSLAEWCEANSKPDAAARLDKAMLEAAWTDPATAADAFLVETEALGRRPVLFVDNLDLIVDALPGDQDWALRRTLQAPGGPVLYGAAVNFLRQSGDREAAFYEFFRPHVLEPLTEDELMACLRRLADARGAAGEGVRKILARDRGRLRTLHTLTGGNPRVLSLVYQILEFAGGSTAFADLEALFDQVTPFYKARVEDYKTDLQRAVIDAIALNWDPITSHDLAAATAVEVTTISSQLSRLRSDGLVEEVRTSGARAGHQLVERFFNIWYLMRHGTRQTRQRVYWLTAFLSSFYAPRELRQLWRDDKRMRWAPEYREALAAAVERIGMPIQPRPPGNIGEDEVNVNNGVSTAARAVRRRARAAAGLADKAFMLYLNGYLEQAVTVFDDLVNRFGADAALALREQVSWALVNKGITLGNLGHGDQAIAVYEEVAARFGTDLAPKLREQVAIARVNMGITLAHLGRSEEEIASYNDVVTRFGTDPSPALRKNVAIALVHKGATLAHLGRSEEELAVYDDVLARFRNDPTPALREQVAETLVYKGLTFAGLGRSKEAIAVYDDVLACFRNDPTPVLRELVAAALVNKGVMLGRLARHEEEIAVCKDVVVHFGNDPAPELRELAAIARGNLAWCLIDGNRPDEAHVARQSMGTLLPQARRLIDAGFEVIADNLGTATMHLDAILAADEDLSLQNYFDDLLRLLRLAERRGYGERLIAWFEASGHAVRQAPIHAAFVAFVRGERFLRDVNPEVRAPAEKIFAELSDRRRAAEQAAPKPPAKPRASRGRPPKRRLA